MNTQPLPSPTNAITKTRVFEQELLMVVRTSVFRHRPPNEKDLPIWTFRITADIWPEQHGFQHHIVAEACRLQPEYCREQLCPGTVLGLSTLSSCAFRALCQNTQTPDFLFIVQITKMSLPPPKIPCHLVSDGSGFLNRMLSN